MRPYVTAAMLALIPVETADLDTMAVDQYGRLYFNPEWIDKVSVEELAGVVYHEIWHLLRKHPDRLSQYPQSVANLAADLEINDDIRSESIPLPEGVFYPEQFGFPPNQTAEYYAGRILDEYEIEYVPQKSSADSANQSGESTDQSSGQSGQSGQSGRKRITVHVRGFGGLEGSGATGQPAPWESPKGDGSVPHLTKAELEIIREQVAQDVRRFLDGSMRGEIPEHWKRWADDVLTPPEIPWQALLRSLVNSAVTTAAGRVDYTYRRVSRRQYAVDDVVLPGLDEPVVRPAVVLDVSGSVGDESLGVALREVRGILESSHGRIATRVYAVDSQVQAAADVFDVSEIKRILKGGGGTDMGVGIRQALMDNPPCDVVVVITDGYTPWPDRKPGDVPIVVCLLPGGTDTVRTDTVRSEDIPSWARVVKISEV
jgi:predicted metal-dependent peptidase